MPRPRKRYPPDFRRQLIELARAGRSPEALAKEFEPSAQTIRTWVKQAERDAGRWTDGLTSAGREELTRRRRELRQFLVLDALTMAGAQRRPRGVIHHADQGCQHTALAFGRWCELLGVRPSRGSVGDACDNAVADSCFATLEWELLARRRFRTQAEAGVARFRYIEGWYNRHRRHSALGQQSPVHYDKLMSNAA